MIAASAVGPQTNAHGLARFAAPGDFDSHVVRELSANRCIEQPALAEFLPLAQEKAASAS